MARSEMLWRCFCSLCTSQLALPASATGPLHLWRESRGSLRAAHSKPTQSLLNFCWATEPTHLSAELTPLSWAALWASCERLNQKKKPNVFTEQFRSSPSLKLTIRWAELLVTPYVCCATRDSKVVALGNINNGLEPPWEGRTLQNLLYGVFKVRFTFTVEYKSSSASCELQSKTPIQAPALPNVTFWVSHVIQSMLCLTLFLPSYGGQGAKSEGGLRPVSTEVI